MSSIKAPRSTDVLFGRDTGSWSHEGNRVFRAIIRKHQVEYHSKKSRLEKINIVAKIMREMTDNGARFLKLDKTTKEWYAVGRKAVIEKVGHAIRDRHAIAQRRITRRSKAGQDVVRQRRPASPPQQHNRVPPSEPQHSQFASATQEKNNQEFWQENTQFEAHRSGSRDSIHYNKATHAQMNQDAVPHFLSAAANKGTFYQPRPQHLLDVVLPGLSPTSEQNSADMEVYIAMARARRQKEDTMLKAAAVREAALENVYASMQKRRSLAHQLAVNHQRQQTLIEDSLLEARRNEHLRVLESSLRSPNFDTELALAAAAGRSPAQAAVRSFGSNMGMFSPPTDRVDSTISSMLPETLLRSRRSLAQHQPRLSQSAKGLDVLSLLALESSGMLI